MQKLLSILIIILFMSTATCAHNQQITYYTSQEKALKLLYGLEKTEHRVKTKARAKKNE